MTPSQQCPNHQAAKTSEVLHFLSSSVYLQFSAVEWFQHQQKRQRISLTFVSLSWWFRDTPEEYHFRFLLSYSSMLITRNLTSKCWQPALFHLRYSIDFTLTCLVLSHKKCGGNRVQISWLQAQVDSEHTTEHINRAGRILIPLFLQGMYNWII